MYAVTSMLTTSPRSSGLASGMPWQMTSFQGLTLAHFTAQLEDLWDTLLTLELNLSTFGPHPRINLGHMGDEVCLS
jgi:hypothetical protein